MSPKELTTQDKKFLQSQERNKKQQTAIAELENHFLETVFTETRLSPEEIKERYNKLQAILKKAGKSIDTYWVLWLFETLEARAIQKISEVAAPIQTSDPDKVKEQLPHLPETLINNIKLVHKHAGKKALSENASKGGKTKYENRTQDEKDRKELVKQAWLRWQKQPHLYSTQADFATEMEKNDPNLSHDTITKKWIIAWKEELSSHKNTP